MKNTKFQNKKLWGGAFSEKPENLMLEFTSGHDVYPISSADSILIPYDIKLNQAQAYMLYKQKIINKTGYNQLTKGLNILHKMWEKGEFQLDPNLEDVHTNIENWLSKKYGIEAGGKIHTGRSRNDQIVTDMYLYIHDQINFFINKINNLNECIYKASEKFKDIICPGYTHHQHATVTSFGLILHSFYVAFKRDLQGLKDLKLKYNYCPLGAGVGYGTLINIDPKFSTKKLGFKKVFENPIDVISTRGEFESCLAFQINMFLNHASNLAQTLILFSTTEFGFVKLSDKYSTGSSAMPQKKNPDPLELIKASASIAEGCVSSIMQITKCNLIGFNRDSQETKHLIYHLILKTKPIPLIIKGIIDTLIVFPEIMEKQANKGFINSLGLMEMIINKTGLPMRQVKCLIELSIKKTIEKGYKDKIDYGAFKFAQKKSGVEIVLSKDDFKLWQDAKFQFSQIKNLNF